MKVVLGAKTRLDAKRYGRRRCRVEAELDVAGLVWRGRTQLTTLETELRSSTPSCCSVPEAKLLTGLLLVAARFDGVPNNERLALVGPVRVARQCDRQLCLALLGTFNLTPSNRFVRIKLVEVASLIHYRRRR